MHKRFGLSISSRYGFGSALLSLLASSACAADGAAMSQNSLSLKQREASDALDSNKYWLAEPLLKEAVSEAEKSGFDSLKLAHAYGELGRYYRVRGRFMEAEPWFERQMAVKELAYESEPGKLVQPLGSLISFYLEHGTASKAEPLTENLIDIVEGKMRDAHEHSALSAQKLQKGMPLTGWAGKVAPAQSTPLMEWAITCDNLANAYKARGDFALSERLYKIALDVKETILGTGHLSLANSYDSLGSISLEQNDLSEAEYFYRDSLSTTERTLPCSDPQVFNRVDRLAKVLVREGKFADAEKLYLRALHFWDSEPSKYGDEARAHFALGCFYSDRKKYAEAAPVLLKALEISENFNGPCSMSLVPYLRKYAYVLYYLGQIDESRNLRERSDSISQDSPGQQGNIAGATQMQSLSGAGRALPQRELTPAGSPGAAGQASSSSTRTDHSSKIKSSGKHIH